MYVKRLVLHNFRCYEDLDCSFPKDRIYLTGDNGTGKTNVIEAIYYLTIGRSFRKADNSELIRKGEQSASIYLEYHSTKDDQDHSLSCLIGTNYKVFAVDGEKVNSLSKILRKLLAVYYDPSLVFFFKDDPEARRRFLDEALSQLSPQYLFAIGRYKKLLKERNTALQQNYDSDVIDVLKNELINLSYRIVKDRSDLIAKLSKDANRYYSLVFQEGDRNFSLSYKTNCPLEADQKRYQELSMKYFESTKSNESLKKATIIGPHRDDLLGVLNGNSLSGYGSQGENRLASLSLKLAVLDEFAKTLGDVPILLLDDVTSDLDDRRCRNLLSLIHSENQQVFVTGTTIRGGFEDYALFKTNKNQQIQEVKTNE